MTVNRRQILSASAVGLPAAAIASGAMARSPVPPDPQKPPLAALPFRSRADLSGPWRYILDPFDVSGRKPGPRRNVWEDRPTTDEGPLVEYEWATSPQIMIPGDWNTAKEKLHHYEGPAYFQRDLEGPAPDGRRRFLVFEAVNYASRVWLNGQRLAEHEGGFTPFEVEVTEALRPGRNSLVVRADNRHGPETLPAEDFDWKNHGGITRPVWLVDLPSTFIRDVFARLEGDEIVVDIVLDGPQAAGSAVSLDLPGLALRLEGQTDSSGVARIRTRRPSRLALWAPERPVLHDLVVRSGQDQLSERMGFRTLQTRGREILINGRSRYLKGIALHEEAIGANGGRYLDDSAVRALFHEAKALGCNFVRLAHYPHSEAAMRVADELGLLVWAEVPIYWEDVSYGSARTLSLAKAMTSEMVLRDRNRCSVTFWSVANETPQSPERLRFLREVIATVRSLDPTRLVTAALNKNVDVGGVRDGEARLVVRDELGTDLDVIAMNQYEGWYGSRRPGEIHQVSFGSIYDKPLIMSEFGADALAGHHGDRTERWTEEHQAWIFEETLGSIDRSGSFAGVSPWLLKDFRSPRRWHGRFQNGWNRKGVIAPDGQRKLAFEVLRRFYQTKE